jgi:hypothetical protein
VFDVVKKIISREKLKLITSIVKDDINFHKQIGTKYTAKKIVGVIYQSTVLVIRL